MDLSLPKIWKSWYAFRQGKKRSTELDLFSYSLESNLFRLRAELVSGSYTHGPYKTFTLMDSKRRIISVAPIRDRVVHRLLYDYLTGIFDKTFIYDTWSCRKKKGLLRAIFRTQYLLSKYPYAYVWRGDITKFFDSVDQKILKQRIRRKVQDENALHLLDKIIDSYYSYTPGKGMPIGNLTSQIFTNIYLSELDWHICHTIKPLGYVRYGDDFILIMDSMKILEDVREHITVFVSEKLGLTIHPTNNIIIPVKRGIHFLGCDIYPTGRRLRRKMIVKIKQRMDFTNLSSYRGLVLKHSRQNIVQLIDWNILDMLNQL